MISGVRLQNFRSYKDATFEFENGANIIVGPNASGKTNLLEAVMVLARGKSYRAKDINLLRAKTPWTRLDGFFDDHDRVLKLQLTDNSLSKSFLINDKPYARLAIEREVPLVFFEPEQLQLITRGPEYRRQFIDDILERAEPSYKKLLTTYRRTMAQRNALLKNGRGEVAAQVFVWNIKLAESGGKIAQFRQELADRLNKKISRTYSQVAGKKTKVFIDYVNQFSIDSYASQMVSKLEKNLSVDIERGFTSAGPHREDFAFLINNQPIELNASRGEVRSLLLSLKKLEIELIEEARVQKAILLLDDVLSELDSARRQALVDLLKEHQSILTTTDADTVLDYFAKGDHKLIALFNGGRAVGFKEV